MEKDAQIKLRSDIHEIVIVMTSWKGRINLVLKSFESLLKQTMRPDKVFLTLAVDEFPNKEINLPSDLCNFVKDHSDIFKINWVQKNTYSMKKLLPVLKYLKDNDLILTLDEDIIIPVDLIEARCLDFLKFNCKSPISSNLKRTVNYKCCCISCTSMFTKNMVNNIEKIVDGAILNTRNDDRLILYALLLNGFVPRSCSKYPINVGADKHLQQCSESNGMSRKKMYICGAAFDRIMLPKIKQNTSVTLEMKRNLIKMYSVR